MDYLEIILQGYFNDNNRDHLTDYFLRKFKKAKKDEFIEADEFFSGLHKIIEYWEKDLQRNISKRRDMLYNGLYAAKNGTLKYDKMEGKTIEQLRQETIEYCNRELKDVRPDGIGSASFTVHLSKYRPGLNYSMAYHEILNIKNSITQARWKVGYKKMLGMLDKIKNELPEQEAKDGFSVLEWATIFYYADETKLTSSDNTKIKRMENFIHKHSIKTTTPSFKNKYHKAKKRINEKNDYPINKLEKIIPFLKENYKQTVPLLEQDKDFLTTEKPDI
jgi:hypothetical protein